MFTVVKVAEMPKVKSKWAPSQKTIEMRQIVKGLAIGETIKVVFAAASAKECRSIASNFYNAAAFVGRKVSLRTEYANSIGIGTIYINCHE
jgi:hypothetical protein